MNISKNKSTSLYEKHNIDLRKKIVDNTMLQSQPQIQKQPLFRKLHLDIQREAKTSDAKQFTDRNMKFKLDQLEQTLQEMLSDVRNIRQENRELVQFTSLLKQNLVYEDLYGKKADLDQKIQGFSNFIRSVRANSQNRYDQIYSECSQLWKRTEELRENVFNIRMRVERLEQKMGFKDMYRF